MYTEVKTQQLVTITMSVEEWAEWLGNPQTLLIQIQNLALAVLETSQQSNGHKPRKSPKAAKVAGKTNLNSKRTATTCVCPQCQKRFKKEAWLIRHIERLHAVQPASD